MKRVPRHRQKNSQLTRDDRVDPDQLKLSKPWGQPQGFFYVVPTV